METKITELENKLPAEKVKIKFTEQESLSVINEMIERARNNVQKGSGTFMIFWGYMVAIAALLNIILAYWLASISKPTNLSFHIWWIMTPAWIVSFILKYRRGKLSIVKTHIDTIISAVWTAFGFSILIFLTIIFVLAYSTKQYNYFYLINPIIMLITGVGEFITAKSCRFRPFLYGAVAMWIGSLACTLAIILVSDKIVMQFSVLAICMILGFVIPGYQLNKKAKKHV
ncbi:MAG: hypothetical protein LBQ28_02855 [Prevotellaceae bacterium]|jgi:hypothetical protein|nr:hypothetical protein [Prevotellaceae bacterium]